MQKLKLITVLAFSNILAMPAWAVDTSVGTNTRIDTDISTTQDSGVSLSGKAKIMPNATVTTGDNDATTDVRTSVDTDTRVRAEENETETNIKNKSYHNTRGKGHKYGHDR